MSNCARSSLTLTRAVQRPMHQDGVNSLSLALTAAFCGANQHDHGLLVCSGFAGRRDGPVHPGMFVSGCAALRGDVAPLLPGIFFRPFHALSGIT
ncbi:hypothetical protein O7L96_004367 [Salmonella enterica subsp. enterica serovar Muenster]|nr:hypothetical protein [Salmonella enterica subsp. enterica serovar Muenster]